MEIREYENTILWQAISPRTELNLPIYAFTSAAGASGCSSSAIAFSRIASKIKEKRVLCISFDCLACKMTPINTLDGNLRHMLVNLGEEKKRDLKLFENEVVKDDFGVSYLKDNGFFNTLAFLSFEELFDFLLFCSGSSKFDILVLDVPFRGSYANELLPLCEKVIVVGSWYSSGMRANNELFSRLFDSFSILSKKPSLSLFSPLKDEESFEGDVVDIHGQFGSEVRRLVDELL